MFDQALEDYMLVDMDFTKYFFVSQKRLALYTGESALAETAANSIIENACMIPNNIPKSCGSVTFTMPKMHGLRSAHQSPAIAILKNEHMNQIDAVKQNAHERD